MWIISLFLSFPFQNSKTPVIFLDKPHLFPLLSPTTQGFEIAYEDALDDKPVPVSTSKPESFVLNPHLASRFLCSKSHPFLSSWNLFFLLVFSLIFYSFSAQFFPTAFIFGQFPHWPFCLLSQLYYLK